MDIKVPSVGESIFEAEIGAWHKKDGERVEKDDLLVELETDKITLELNAEVGGVLRIAAGQGKTVAIGAVIGTIEEGGGTPGGAAAEEPGEAKGKAKGGAGGEPKDRGKAGDGGRPAPGKKGGEEPRPAQEPGVETEKREARATEVPPPPGGTGEGRTTREPMSRLRRRIAERLLAVRQETAMLTTFNEVDMSRVLALRRKHGEDFKERHGVPLGLMSFFVKACAEALKEFPEVNARIDGSDIVFQHFYDIGIAVGGEKGLVVPILRDVDRLSFAGVEETIRDFVAKIAANRLDLADLEGGTFSITNGGVYGSLLSTPILNPPQSAILGMHSIQDRPVARDGEVVIRPMMNLALSYDHRLIDGRQAVTFLKRVKALIEEPEEMLLEL